MTAACSNLVQHKLFYYSGCVIWAVVCVFVRVFSSPRISTFKAVAGNSGVDSFPFSCATQNSPVDFLQPRHVVVTYCKWHTHLQRVVCLLWVKHHSLRHRKKRRKQRKKKRVWRKDKGKKISVLVFKQIRLTDFNTRFTNLCKFA